MGVTVTITRSEYCGNGADAAKNVVQEDNPGGWGGQYAGAWGGTCTCPDGMVYEVGDNHDSCGSLACEGGVAGECKQAPGTWSGRKVTCATGMQQWSLAQSIIGDGTQSYALYTLAAV